MGGPQASVGVLDSGIGGLSVLRRIHRLLPAYPTLYFADQAHLPYGPRPVATIQAFVDSITRFLVDQGAVMIVIACNTASAAALHEMRRRYPQLPFVGMEPAVKPAAEHSRSRIIAVLSTQTTAEGDLYRRLLERYGSDVQVLTRVAPELVSLAEEQGHNTRAGRAAIAAVIQPLVEAGADEIVLACTHFPFLGRVIQEVAGPGVRVIDPSEAVARRTAQMWPANVRPGPGPSRYFTSGDPDLFRHRLSSLIDVEARVEAARWSDGLTIELL